MRRWARNGLVRCYEAWTHYVEERKRARAVAARVLGALSAQRECRALNKLRDHAVELARDIALAKIAGGSGGRGGGRRDGA